MGQLPPQPPRPQELPRTNQHPQVERSAGRDRKQFRYSRPVSIGLCNLSSEQHEPRDSDSPTHVTRRLRIGLSSAAAARLVHCSLHSLARPQAKTQTPQGRQLAKVRRAQRRSNPSATPRADGDLCNGASAAKLLSMRGVGFSFRSSNARSGFDAYPHRFRYFAGDVVLDHQDVVEWSIVGLRPDDVPVVRTNQPRGDPHPGA